MPQFGLDHGSPYSAARYKALDAFTQGYIEAMMWTDAPEASLDKLAPETWQIVERDCAAFQIGNAAALSAATDGGLGQQWPHSGGPYTMHRAGRDYWLTRNGHGAGFDDHGMDAAIEADLVRAATSEGVRDVYTGHDGKLYLFGGYK
jgi:hypothetical protein